MSFIDIYFLGAALFFFAYAFWQSKNPAKTIKYPFVLGILTLAFFIFRFIEFLPGYLVTAAAAAIFITFQHVIFDKRKKRLNQR